MRYLVCAPVRDHTLWDGGSKSLSVSVYEVQGSDNETNYVRNQIGGALQFTESDGAGVSKRLTINLPTSIENGQLQVKFSAVSTEPTSTTGNGLGCILAGVE